MNDERKFYQVITDLYHLRLPDHHQYGYETERDFLHALYQLRDYWKERIGECIEERYTFRLLRFHDTPGGKPDEAWLPDCLLAQVDTPDYMMESDSSDDEIEAELDRIFGFD